jgi:hypothetical protein
MRNADGWHEEDELLEGWSRRSVFCSADIQRQIH